MDFEVIECKGIEALALLEKLRQQFPGSGKYPFLIGDQENLDQLAEAAGFIEVETASIVAEALKLDVAKWFKDRPAELWEDGDFDEAELLGEWPSESPEPSGLAAHCDVLTGKELPVVYVGLASLQQPWTLPAVAKFGDWNACPEPAVHCALMNYWGKNHGAEIVSMGFDVIECKVSRPPQTREAALALAWEQFWYCEDIVTQGVETISDLAATLINANHWYFWWD